MLGLNLTAVDINNLTPEEIKALHLRLASGTAAQLPVHDGACANG
jgi:hypothetical protein